MGERRDFGGCDGERWAFSLKMETVEDVLKVVEGMEKEWGF